MGYETDGAKRKMHEIIDNAFDAAVNIVYLFNNLNGLFPEKEKKVIDLKLIKNDNKKD